MKRFYIFLAVLVFGLTACDTTPNNEVIDPNAPVIGIEDIVTGEEFISFISQDWEIDDNALVESLISKGLVQSIYMRISDIESTDEIVTWVDAERDRPLTTKFVFSEDGTCRQYIRQEEKMLIIDDFFGEIVVGTGKYVYMESEPLKWEYDAEENKLMTFDNYGNSSTAIILYADDKKICYQGAIARECHYLSFNKDLNGSKFIDINYGVTNMVDDRSCWSCDEPESMEVLYFHFVDKDDQRAKMILQADAERGEIDDEAFVDKLLSSAISLALDTDANEEGCPYYRTYVYSVKDNFMIYSAPLLILNHLMVFMEDGTARCCSTYGNYYLWTVIQENEPEGITDDDKVYVTREWRYDADTNTIFSFRDKAQAEVIYFDGEIAILKGFIFGGISPSYPVDSDYNYMIFDFSRADRATVLEEYTIDITDYI